MPVQRLAKTRCAVELIGINSQILSGSAGGGNIGIAFSIPSNMAKSVMEQLIKDGRVRRGMLGINIQNVTDELAKSLDLEQRSGVIVSNVRAGSAAEKAGIKRNDLIVAINDRIVSSVDDVHRLLSRIPQDAAIEISLVRDWRKLDVPVRWD